MYVVDVCTCHLTSVLLCICFPYREYECMSLRCIDLTGEFFNYNAGTCIYMYDSDGTQGVILIIVKAGCHLVAIAQVVEH